MNRGERQISKIIVNPCDLSRYTHNSRDVTIRVFKNSELSSLSPVVSDKTPLKQPNT